MKLQVFRALWGMTGSPQDQIRQIAEAGYDGVEGILHDVPRKDYMQMLQDHNLKLIIFIFAADAKVFKESVTRVAEYQPIKICSHSGRDTMTRDEGRAFFESALQVEKEIGIDVAHETHRSRLFFTPWETAYYLREFPELKVTADFSHWVTVCERLPDDQPEALALACERAIHIHGRVGYEEGPQVPDPAAPEYRGYLDWHETQWQKIRAAHEEAGSDFITFTPEYGPPGYLHTLPYTNVPVADLWQVCLWGAKRIRELWSDLL